MRTAILMALAVAIVPTAAPHAGARQDASERPPLFEAIKQRILAGDWNAAHELVREAAMVKHLEHAAKAAPMPTKRGIMDTSDTRQTALVRLGKHYQKKGEYRTALEYFTQWKPGSWCGNGLAQFQYERDLSIAECLRAMGHANRAVNEHLMPYLGGDGERLLYFDHRIPALVVEIHEEQGDLDGLIRRLRPLAKATPSGTVFIARELAQIRMWRRDGKITELIAQLRHQGSFVPDIRRVYDNWRAPAAARALAEFGGKEFPALKKRYEAMLARQAAGGNDMEYGDRLWVVYAIGLSHSPGAGAYLSELVNRDQDARGTAGVGRDDLRYALSLAGAGGSADR